MRRFVLLALIVPALAFAEDGLDQPDAPEESDEGYDIYAMDDDDSADGGDNPYVGVPIENRVPGGGCHAAAAFPGAAGVLLGLGLLATRRR
jgi:hypothetical protein